MGRPKKAQKTTKTTKTTKTSTTTATKSGVPSPQGIQKRKRFSKKDTPLFEKRPRNFGIGQDIRPKRDLTHFVRWPKYIRLQRQRRILLSRLKVPPVINQFTNTLDKNSATTLFKLLHAHRPEDKAAKKKKTFGSF